MTALISYRNLIDEDGTWILDDGSASPGVPGSEENLRNMQRTRKWIGPRAPITGGANSVEYSFAGGVTDVQLVAIFDHDFDPVAPSSAIIQYKNAADAYINIGFFQTATDGDLAAPHAVIGLDAPVQAKAIRMIWNTDASPADTVSASRLWAGPAIDIGESLVSHSEQVVLISEARESYGRQLTEDTRWRELKVSSFELSRPPLQLVWGSAGATGGTLIDLLLSRGQSGDLVYLPAFVSPAEARRSVNYGTVVGNTDLDGLWPESIRMELLEL